LVPVLHSIGTGHSRQDPHKANGSEKDQEKDIMAEKNHTIRRVRTGIYTVLKESFSPQKIHRPCNTQSIAASSGVFCEKKS
jgi:hypothetical protein